MPTRPKKVHWYEDGKVTKCGRDPIRGPAILFSKKRSKVTCGQCLEPNRPFAGGGWRQS